MTLHIQDMCLIEPVGARPACIRPKDHAPEPHRNVAGFEWDVDAVDMVVYYDAEIEERKYWALVDAERELWKLLQSPRAIFEIEIQENGAQRVIIVWEENAHVALHWNMPVGWEGLEFEFLRRD